MRRATPVTGLVMDAIQKRESGDMGFLDSMSEKPNVPRCSVLFFETTTVTAPAISFLAIISSMAELTAGSFGLAAFAEKRIEASRRIFGRCMTGTESVRA